MIKYFILIAFLAIAKIEASAQYCDSTIRPDYREIINHSNEPNYKPCRNQSRKAWFYVQQQRLENRMEKLMVNHKDQIQTLAKTYIQYVEEYHDWTYESRPQFERGINFLNNIDGLLDDIQLG